MTRRRARHDTAARITRRRLFDLPGPNRRRSGLCPRRLLIFARWRHSADMRRRLPIARRRGRSPDLRLRGELEQSPALAILEQPDRPVRALFDGAYARAHVEALRLARAVARSEEHTSELQSLMRSSYAVFC